MILKIKGVYANRIWPLLIPSVFCLSCSLFDDSLLDQQRAEIVRLKKEAETLRQETAALQTKKQKSDREKESCNAAFEDFEDLAFLDFPYDSDPTSFMALFFRAGFFN